MKKKKLRLQRQTLRDLTARELAEPEGGSGGTCATPTGPNRCTYRFTGCRYDETDFCTDGCTN